MKRGYLLPGSVPVGIGINSAVMGTAVVDKNDLEVIAKKLPAAEIDIEVFCAVIALLWELPALEPMVLTDDQGALHFACSRVGKRNMVQAFNLDGLDTSAMMTALKPLSGWKHAPKVSAFDEAIDNRDRNLGNILWTDEDDFLLIDHGLALGKGTGPNHNKLLALAIALNVGNDVATQKLKKETLSAAKKLDEDKLDDAGNKLRSDLPEADQHIAFVRLRLQSLLSLIKARFPNGQLPLISTP